MMAAAALQFYSLNELLGPLSISIGYMIKDFFNFVFLIIVFIIPYGVIMQVTFSYIFLNISFLVTLVCFVPTQMPDLLYHLDKGRKNHFWPKIIFGQKKSFFGRKNHFVEEKIIF